MSAVVSGLIGGAIATALAAVALRSQKSARTDSDGWCWLRPGWLIHFAVGGCFAFVLAVSYFLWLAGSARTDAELQNFWAMLIMLGFGAGGLWLVWAGYLHRVAWRGNDIRLVRPLRRDTYYRFTDIVSVRPNGDGSEFKLRFADARVLRVSPYFHGFYEFKHEMAKRLSLFED